MNSLQVFLVFLLIDVKSVELSKCIWKITMHPQWTGRKNIVILYFLDVIQMKQKNQIETFEKHSEDIFLITVLVRSFSCLYILMDFIIQ